MEDGATRKAPPSLPGNPPNLSISHIPLPRPGLYGNPRTPWVVGGSRPPSPRFPVFLAAPIFGSKVFLCTPGAEGVFFARVLWRVGGNHPSPTKPSCTALPRPRLPISPPLRPTIHPSSLSFWGGGTGGGGASPSSPSAGAGAQPYRVSPPPVARCPGRPPTTRNGACVGSLSGHLAQVLMKVLSREPSKRNTTKRRGR